MSNHIKTDTYTCASTGEVTGVDTKAVEQLFQEAMTRHQNQQKFASVAQAQLNDSMLRLVQEKESLDLTSKTQHADHPRRRTDPETLRQALSTMSDSPAATAATVRPFSPLDKKGLIVPEDIRLQLFAPPYTASGVGKSNSGNGDVQANADRDGNLYVLEQNAGGSAYARAGIWVQFTPDPSSAFVQVRPLVSYQYEWVDSSSLGYTAHNHGGFGVFVWSSDHKLTPLGGPNGWPPGYSYSVWSDGTGWWDTHSDSGSGYAFVYGHEPPYFPVETSRTYQAYIYCWANCDSSNGFFGHANADAQISAMVRLVVIGER